MTSTPDRQSNLSNARSTVQKHAEKMGCIAPPESHRATARHMARSMPLSHGATAEGFARIAQGGAIFSQQTLARSVCAPLEYTTEVQLGTANHVFLFAAPFRYPSSDCGFLFKCDLEQDHRADGEASPFDSGGLLCHFTRPAAPTVSPVDFLQRHTLPIPDHRELLEETLTRLFHDPDDYRSGGAPHCSCPFGLHGGDARRWTHEVRIPEKLGVDTHLEAIFVVEGRESDPRVETYITRCRSKGITFVQVRRPSDRDGEGVFDALRNRCAQYVRDLIQARAS